MVLGNSMVRHLNSRECRKNESNITHMGEVFPALVQNALKTIRDF